MTWSDGYFTDIDYTYGYYRELNPAVLRLACIAANVRPPDIEECTYLELGFGQGVSINLHAAAAPGNYWGIDFNPAQTLHAQTLAKESGAPVSLHDQSFAEFAARDDLPMFDVIVLHGVWSWISADNRRSIIDIIRRRLRVGGIVYLSYNCLPGWAAQVPLRHLMARHIEMAAPRSADTAAKIDNALAFAREIAAGGARYFTENPALDPFMKNIGTSNRHYLAHEYFNADWEIGYFADVAAELEAAKLTYAAPARLLDHLPEYSMRAQDAKLLAGIRHPLMRETVRDYLVNQKFRTDIFVKGARPLNGVDARGLWMDTSFTLTVPMSAMSFKHATPMGELSLDESIYRPLVTMLADDGYRAKSVVEIAERLGAFDIRELLSGLMMLSGLGVAQPARKAGEAERRQCDALNLYLCHQALSSADIQVLASPVLGGGKAMPQEHQLVVMAILAGMQTPQEQALYLDSVFQAHNLKLRRDGIAAGSGQDAIHEFEGIATRFHADGHAALLRALCILPAEGDVARQPALTALHPSITAA
ncbi:class I SAM-dependent methyltransferase [Sphingomonas sp.]|uniref:class I SAM-dependent methyltransferase n=1 Tax=Sphingomonas sp. TaxID=28214 RepID=UPI002BFA5C50|nr:class I SAM-dependent methyltransferase [Sphingomonas sp.]HTG37653.1 class I SAM-dependent methyltransferase [Sphingomonas sp.]